MSLVLNIYDFLVQSAAKLRNKKVKRLEEQIKRLESQNRAQSKEMARISSITWYQKLFGKK